MSDKRSSWGLSRRQLLWLLGLGVPVNAGLLTALARGDAQLPAPRNFRFAAPAASPDSPIVRGQHPRTFFTPASLAALRSRLTSDAAFRSRWQQAVSSFEASGGLLGRKFHKRAHARLWRNPGGLFGRPNKRPGPDVVDSLGRVPESDRFGLAVRGTHHGESWIPAPAHGLGY